MAKKAFNALTISMLVLFLLFAVSGVSLIAYGAIVPSVTPAIDDGIVAKKGGQSIEIGGGAVLFLAFVPFFVVFCVYHFSPSINYRQP